MEVPFFSIVVPVYNCEKYLNKCVDSILAQTCSDWELILVNDGSKDKSLEICHFYRDTFPSRRIAVLDQNNGGVSVARNSGLKVATGKYIVFVDSDDWLDDATILETTKGIATIKDVDCFVGMFQSIFETENAIPIFTERMKAESINGKSQEEVLTYFHHLRLILTVWRFIAKREIMVKNDIWFEKGLLHEDEIFAALLTSNCHTFYLLPDRWYAYRIRDNSITTSKTLYNYECYIRIAGMLLEASKQAPTIHQRQYLLRICSENLNLAKSGTDYFGKPMYLIPEGRKFLGLKELM